MRDSRLDKARDRVVDAVEEIAEDRGMEITPASNRAHDVALQDPELRELCESHRALSDSESLIRANGRSCSDPIYEETLDAGRSIDNAIRSRVEELIEEIIERERARQIEEGMSA
jgi:uncharacterized FAD-dependent dehydrogenase